MQAFSTTNLELQEFLEEIVSEIVMERRWDDKPLTWRAMHEIEEEAIRQLEESGHAAPNWIRMLRNSKEFCRYPITGEPVDFGRSNILSITASMIKATYEKASD